MKNVLLPGFNDLYSVTIDGKILNTTNGHIYTQFEDKGGYMMVALRKDGKTKSYRVNKLVYLAYHGKITKGMQIDHKDGNRKNNHAENLQQLSPRDNTHKTIGPNGEYKDGICYHRKNGKWVARIQLAGTRYYLGIYETEVTAEMAYKTALAEWMENGRTPEPKKHLPDDIKHCSGCGKDLPKSRFYYLATYKRYSALCRDCHQAKMKEIRARKKDTINP